MAIPSWSSCRVYGTWTDVEGNRLPGTVTAAISARGTNNNHVLVLIDGVRVASLNTGAYAFEQVPLDLIERIEIVRGPRASFWGSDAIGGVIQIFTRKLEGPRISAGYGSYGDAIGTVDCFGHGVAGIAQGDACRQPDAGGIVHGQDFRGHQFFS